MRLTVASADIGAIAFSFFISEGALEGSLKLGLNLAGELGELVALPFLAFVAQLALDRLQLLVQIIFALGLLHLALDAAADVLLDLEHPELALHEGKGHLEPPNRVELREQSLLVRHLDIDVGGDGVGELGGFLDLAELDGGLGRQLAVQLRIILELLDHRAHQRRDLGALGLAILDRLDLGDEVLASCRSVGRAGALRPSTRTRTVPSGSLSS